MVLNNDGIIQALNNGSIKITEYTWGDYVSSKNFDVTKLKGSHKVRLHVGFLVRTLSDKRWLPQKILYNKRDGIIDLRKVEERKYILQPKESVIIFTNEAIKMGADYFGLILSRVSLEETGLVVSQSYIDPNWDGVLQLIITNHSESPQILQEHCEIANLVLFKMEHPAHTTSQKKNEHYGVTWEVIAENPMFPKWQDRRRSWTLRLRHIIRSYWLIFTGIGVAGLFTICYQIISTIVNIIKLIYP